MPKNYVILNFTDYRHHEETTDTRSTPVSTLASAFQRRVERKGGSFAIHHLADFFGELRLARRGRMNFHEIQGILDLPAISSLMIEAGVYRSGAWSRVRNDCRDADKIIFAAHGHKDDRENVYCDHNTTSVRCGSVDGVVEFLTTILNGVNRPDPTITLVVCYAARSGAYEKHHVDQPLDEGDVRSSLAFKIFMGLVAFRPQLRLTARTGAVSASSVGTSLTSETEEAIMASETIRTEFADSEQLLADTMEAYNAFDVSLDGSNLTTTERNAARDALYKWFTSGCNPDDLDEIITAIDRLDSRHKPKGHRFLETLCCCGMVDLSWFNWYRQAREGLEDIAPRRHEMHRVHTISQRSEAKYGKFIYQRDDNHIVVSRWLGDVLAEMMRLDG
jgi:hypothetical protein